VVFGVNFARRDVGESLGVRFCVGFVWFVVLGS